MANDTRSSSKVKDDDSSSVKGRHTSGAGTRRSMRETCSSKNTTPSPPGRRKSERLENRSPGDIPVQKKSEKIEKLSRPSPLRRSERGNKQNLPSSSKTKKSNKSPGSSNVKQKGGKRERSVKELTLEARKVSSSETHDPESIRVKKKRVGNAQIHKALFIEQKERIGNADSSEELELNQSDQVPQVDNTCSDHSQKIEDVDLKHRGMSEVEPTEEHQSCKKALGISDDSSSNSEDTALENQGRVEVLSDLSQKESWESVVDGLHTSRSSDNSLSAPGSHFSPESLIEADNSSQDKLPISVTNGSISLKNSLDGDVDLDGNKPSKRKRSEICAMDESKVVHTDCKSLSPPVAKRNFSDKCPACFKRQRMDYDSAKEICSCNLRLTKDIYDTSIHKARTEAEGSVMTGVAEKCNEIMQQKEPCRAIQTDANQNTCPFCKLGVGGKLLCCNGKGCKQSYHLSCILYAAEEVPPGVWHCPLCVKKKIQSGVHSVSDGIESIWDTREMEVSGSKGMQKQRHLFIKYKGLAHAHNQWVPESQLLLEDPVLVAQFNEKSQFIRWKPEWALPHRLLKKRLNEWLVKWQGLDYEHCTWELENAPFFSSPEAQRLIIDYGIRSERARRVSAVSEMDKGTQQTRQGPLVKLSKLPDGCSSNIDINHLHHVNKLCDYWLKQKNAVIFYDQDRIVKVIVFILSVWSESCLPFLIISPSSTLSLWESECFRLAPSMNAIVYNGNREFRKKIRTIELYDDEGRVMFQVLLASPEAIVEDLEVFKGVRWAATIVDDVHCSGVSAHYEQFRVLATDLRLVFFSSPMKDNTEEYLNILSFLESGKDAINTGEFRGSESDSITKLKERLARHIAYECKLDRFLEYWVPVQISNVQLEQYCHTLLSNSLSLGSKNDPVGALPEILISVRKTCNHPYLVDLALQTLMVKDLKESEYLDVGVKASGKLQLLDKMLLEIKRQGLRVLILYESVGGSGRDSIGDFLDDFLHQRFGIDSYERVDGGGFIPSRKQAALNKFNNKESGRFVFLLEKCACLPSIKLLSVDAVIIFDSDWNPMNDSRALQKITIDSQFEQIKVIRLYTSSTVEENVLTLAKHDMNLEGKLSNINRSTSHKLLLWGASYLFTELEKFHGNRTANPTAHTSSEQSLLDNVVQELIDMLLQSGEHKVNNSSVILKIQQNGGSHGRNFILPGKLEIPIIDEQLPHVLWTKLLEGRNPQWKYLSCSTQRNRRRIQYLDNSTKSGVGRDEVVKKQKKVVNSCTISASKKSGSEVGKVVAGDREGAPGSSSKNVSQSSPGSNTCMDATPHASQAPTYLSHSNILTEPAVVKSDKKRNVRDAQKSLHLLLKPEILKLCELLRLTEDVKSMAERFLQYVMDNHHVSKEPVSILQAFQLSMCWTAASLLKHKIDRKESLDLAKQHLNFCCNEEEVDYVHLMLGLLKDIFSYHIASQRFVKSSLNPVIAAKDATRISSLARSSQSAASNLQNVKLEAEEGLISHEIPVSQDHSQQEQAPDLDMADRAVLKIKKRIEKRCRKRMVYLRKKQKEELENFFKVCDEEKAQLEKEYRMELAVVHSIHGPSKAHKWKSLDETHRKKLDYHKCQLDLNLKNLRNAQLDAWNEEEEKQARWTEEMKSWAEVELKHKLFSNESVQRVKKSLKVPDLQISDHMKTHDNPKDIAEEHSTMAGAGGRAQGNAKSLQLLDRHIVTESPHSISAETSSSPENVAHENASSPAQDLCRATMPARMVEHEEVVLGAQDTAVDQPDGECSINEDAVPLVLSPVNLPSVQTVSGPSDCAPLPFDEAPQGECSQLASSTRLQDDNTVMRGTYNVLQQIEGQQLHPAVSSDQPDIEAQIEDPLALSRRSPGVEVPVSHVADASTSDQCDNEAPAVEHPMPSLLPLCANMAPGSELQNFPAVVDTETISSGLSNLEAPVTVDTENAIPSDQSNLKAPVVEAGLQTQLSSSRNLLPADQSDLLLGHENHEPSYQLPASPQNRPNLPSDQVLVQPMTQVSYNPTTGIPSYQLESHLLDTRTLSSYSNQGATTAPPAASRRVIVSPPDPLQTELERMRIVTDQIIKMHDDTKLHLKLEHEKEIAESRRKYKAKLQDAEAVFLLKKKESDSYNQKLYMNMLLAEAFRSKCMDTRASGSPGFNQGLNTMQQHLSRPSLQESGERHPSVACTSSVGLPSASVHATGTTTVHIARSSLVGQSSASPVIVPPSRPSSVAAQSFPSSAPPPPNMSSFRPSVNIPSFLGQTLASPRSIASLRTPRAAGPPSVGPTTAATGPPIQIVHDSSALFSNVSTRSPHTSSITHPTINLQGQSGIRTPAPHLRRPSTSLASTATTSFLRGLPSQHPRTNSQAFSSLHPQYQNVPLPPAPTHQSVPFSNMTQPRVAAGLGGFPNSSLSALDLLTDIENRSRANLPNNLPNTDSGVVCLSDDD